METTRGSRKRISADFQDITAPEMVMDTSQKKKNTENFVKFVEMGFEIGNLRGEGFQPWQTKRFEYTKGVPKLLSPASL